MADSGAERARRHRLHKAGDHSLCRHAALAPVPDIPQAEIDPRAELEAVARRLTAAHQAEPGNANVARELRITLLALGPAVPAADPLDELRAMSARVS